MTFKGIRRRIERLINFYAETGFVYTLLEIQNRLRSITRKRHSYRSLLNKFSQKFSVLQSPHRTADEWSVIIDSAVQESIQELLQQLGISEDASHALPALKGFLKKDRYYQSLEDYFTLEQFGRASAGGVIYPLLQASELPEEIYPVRRRRILFITSQFPSPYHGGGNRVLNFIKILSQNNDIYLSTCFIPEDDQEALQIVLHYCRSIQKIHHWRFGGNQAEIRNWLGSTSMDIIHYEWPRSLENFDRSYGRHHIFTYMEAVSLRLAMDMEQMKPLSAGWLERFSELLHTLRLELVDAALLNARIAVTNKDGDFFKSIHPYQEYAVLNHGVTFDEFCLPDVEPVPHTLVFVGNYEHYPNVDALTYFFNEIWGGIQKEVPDARIYLVGSRPTKDIMDLADGKRIVVTGNVPDVRPYIQRASVCIAPLLKGAGLRGKVIEYAALRRPFVATSIATTDLVFKDGVDYLCADTAAEFIRKVAALLKDSKMAKEMAANAFETARQNYDTRRLVNFLCRLYQYLEKA